MNPIYYPLRTNGRMWYVPETYRAWCETGPFTDFAGLLARGRQVKDLRTKRTVEVTVEGKEFLVKIYKSQGFLQNLRAKVFGSRAMVELTCLNRVMTVDVPTLPFAAVGEWGGESYVIIEKANDRVRLDDLLEGIHERKRRRGLIVEYGRWARQVHDAGVLQDDFNPSNVLGKREGPADLRLIDFERMDFTNAITDEERLRSLAKIDRMMSVSRTDRLRFLKAYFGASRAREVRGPAGLIVKYAAEKREDDAARQREACVTENRNFGKYDGGFYRKTGMTSAETTALDGSGFRRVAADDAVAAWRDAFGRVGGDKPVAVRVGKDGRRGEVIYRLP